MSVALLREGGKYNRSGNSLKVTLRFRDVYLRASQNIDPFFNLLEEMNLLYNKNTYIAPILILPFSSVLISVCNRGSLKQKVIEKVSVLVNIDFS